MGEVVEVGKGVSNLTVGDRVVVPFPIACGDCNACAAGITRCARTPTPTPAWRRSCGATPASGMFGYSHLTGGFAGGQAEYVRVPFADVGPIKIESDLPDEQVLFLSDIFPTGYMGAEMCDIKPGDVVAVWGAGPVGCWPCERVPARRREGHRDRPVRLPAAMARDKTGAETLNYDGSTSRTRSRR